jgi:hypothetical protein
MRSFLSLRKWIPLFALVFAFLAAGCGDDDNPVNSDPGTHLEAIGAMLILGTDTLVTVNGTQVSGELEVHEGDTLAPIEIRFLNPDDNSWYDPTGLGSASHSLHLEEYSTDVANMLIGSAMPGVTDPWEFGILGVEAGTTSARIKIYHLDHPDYTSPLIPIRVEHEHENAVGCKLVLDGVDVVIADGSNITGSLNLITGTTTGLISVWFLSPDGDWFQPEEDRYTLGTTIAGSSFTLDTNVGERWQFSATGTSVGEGQLQLRLMHEDHADFTSPQLPVNTVNG